jgi:hypothetical protein
MTLAEKAYETEYWTEVPYHEGLLTEPLPRLSMGIAIPRDVGDRASGMAAVKNGRMARIKECEKYMSDLGAF